MDLTTSITSKDKVKFNCLAIIAIVVLGVLIYGRYLDSPLVYDDVHLIHRGIYIKSLSYLPRMFVSNFWAPFYDKVIDGRGYDLLYRPITSVSFALNYLLGRQEPFSYRLVNLALHILNGLLVYLFISRFLKERMLGLFVALIFIVHPLQAESVLIITHRAGILATSFLLGSLIFYLLADGLKGKKAYLLNISVALYLLALLSKETAIILPFVVLLYDFSFRNRLRFKTCWRVIFDYSPLWVTTLLYLLLRQLALGNFLSAAGHLTDKLGATVLTMLKVVALYICRMLLPLRLSLTYADPLARSILEPEVLVGLFVLLSCLALLPSLYKKEKAIFFALGWYLVSLLPVSNILPIGAAMADRWLYVPLIGFFLCLGLIVKRVLKVPFFLKVKRFALIGSFCLISFYSLLGFVRASDWKDPLFLWSKTLKIYPKEFWARVNVASFLLKERSFDEAEKVYLEILSQEGISEYEKAKVYHNLGVLYENTSRIAKAQEYYRLSTEINPQLALPYLALGMLAERQGYTQEAIRHYQQALRLEPYLYLAHFRLGVIYARERDLRAIEHFKKAVQIRPDFAPGHESLAILYACLDPPQKDLSRMHLERSRALVEKDRQVSPAIEDIEKFIYSR
jgi:tetratricopeptide (TPR) repeat protein